MFTKTLTTTLAAACVALSASAAQAQSPLNPFSWFAPAPAYGFPQNCANGNCGPINGYAGYPAANCPNGNCAVTTGYRGYPANCPNGNCAIPAYQAYRPSSAQPLYSVQPMPVGNFRPVTNMPAPQRPLSTTNYGPSANSQRMLNPASSPFYP